MPSTGSYKSGAGPATLPLRERLPPILRRTTSTSSWPCPLRLRLNTVITHRMGISGLGPCWDFPSPSTRSDLRTLRSYAQASTVLSYTYMSCARVPSCRRSTSISWSSVPLTLTDATPSCVSQMRCTYFRWRAASRSCASTRATYGVASA